MWDRCVAGDRLRTVMSSIMRRRRGLKSAISILLSEGVGSNTHILSARRRSTPPRHARRDSGFVQSGGFCEVALTRGRGRRLSRDLIEAGLNEGAGGYARLCSYGDCSILILNRP